MLERADSNDDAVEIDILSPLIEGRKWRYLGKALEHVDLTKLGCDQGSIPGSQKGGDGGPGEQFAVHVNPSAEVGQERVEPGEVLRIGIGHEIHITSCPQISPGIYRQSADQDEAHVCLDQARQQLPQPNRIRRRQLFRALPVKVERNSLSANPSARLTASGRRASSSNCRRRDASL